MKILAAYLSAPELKSTNSRGLQLGSLLVLFLTLFSLTVGHAQITPLQDSYTNSAAPSTNYGTAGTLNVEDAGPIDDITIQNTYIQFDLSSIPSGYTGADVAKATLKLYVNAVATPGAFYVINVVGPWTESGKGSITYNLNPGFAGNAITLVSLKTANVHDYINIDVTSALQGWLNDPESNYGLALVGDYPVNVSFDSKENTAESHPPELDVVYAGTISGVNTASGSGLTNGGTSGTLDLSLLPCSTSGQILQWNGSAWQCSTVSTGGGGIGGGGTTSYLPIFNSASTVANSNVFQSGGNVGVGTTTPQAALDVNGAIAIGGQLFAFGSPTYNSTTQTGGSVFLGFAGSASSTAGQDTAVGGGALTADSGSGANTAVPRPLRPEALTLPPFGGPPQPQSSLSAHSRFGCSS